MRVLIAHNKYQLYGGEDSVVETEASMLRAAGHEVEIYFADNSSIKNPIDKLKVALRSSSNSKSIKRIIEYCERVNPDVVHFHNTFPLITPGAVSAIAQRGTKTVVTLHNYRMICAGALLVRNGTICEKCLASSGIEGVMNKCYRGSSLGTAAVTLAGAKFRNICAEYPEIKLIALTEFAKNKLAEGGFRTDQIVVKANTVADLGKGSISRERRVAFIGRCSEEKGVQLLMGIARHLHKSSIGLDVIGDGPDRVKMEAIALPNVKFWGHLSRSEVIKKIKETSAVLMPSRWYEGFPMVLLEAFSTGTPAVVSKLGSLEELVEDGITGFTRDAYDLEGWTEAIHRLIYNPTFAREMGGRARLAYEAKYSQDVNLRALEAIYRQN